MSSISFPSHERLGDPANPPIDTKLALFRENLRIDVSNFFLYEFRKFDGFFITGKNSGTHWVKYMLSCAIAQDYGVPPPEFSSGESANDIIGNPRTSVRREDVPRIASSHTIPSLAFSWLWLTRLLRHPPVVVLVRDIEEALISHYVKWKDIYKVSLEEYLRGDPKGRRFEGDIWWYIRFFNHWGAIRHKRPEDILVLHYEDVQQDPHDALAAATRHWGLAVSDGAIDEALPYASREAIRAKLDPASAEQVIPAPEAKAALGVNDVHRAWIRRTLRRHLRHDLGYAPKPLSGAQP